MRKILFLAVAIAVLVALTQTAQQALTVSRNHSELLAKRIYAYRDWQSTGVRIDQGDLVEIQAEGEWLYTPDEFHGPGGHPVFPAPSFYPVSSGSGGALIGRIGENGLRFVVGKRVTHAGNPTRHSLPAHQ